MFDVVAYDRLRISKSVGAAVHYRERTGSTMDDARERVATVGHEACGSVYVAGEQSAGRGRRGRSWISAAAAGLYATYCLCPRTTEVALMAPIAGGVAVADAVSGISGLPVELKWPNDVLCRERKLAGVLAEAEHGDHLTVLLGIGINVRATRELPPEVAQIATSIERAGAPPPRLEALLAALSSALEHWVDLAERDAAALIGEWRSRLSTLGRRVRFATPTGEVEGEAVDVDARGELILRLDDGTTAAFAAGDVTTI